MTTYLDTSINYKVVRVYERVDSDHGRGQITVARYAFDAGEDFSEAKELLKIMHELGFKLVQQIGFRSIYATPSNFATGYISNLITTRIQSVRKFDKGVKGWQ